jgi:AcrR family transcriptional regulator
LNTVKIKRARRRGRATYHHGDLRQGLLQATEQIILERGVDGFTLREAARRVGVSPAAPAHHFKDAKGLLTEVAMLGFREFGDALEQADRAAGTDPAARLRAQAVAYVRFAFKQPARFQLMFRHDKQDRSNEELARAASRAYGVLENAVRAATGVGPQEQLPPNAFGFLLANWSIVHGFAHLALGGELQTSERGTYAPQQLIDSLLPLMLAHLPSPRPQSD